MTQYSKYPVEGGGGGGSGTVTSVALTAPSAVLTISGSPITTSGTLAITFHTQTANLVWAGPTTGAAAAPTFRSLVSADLPSGVGTVTSVAMTVPAIMSIAGSPVTSSGTLAVTLATQAANLVWAGPTTGSAATPTFRSLVAADLPGGTGTVTSVSVVSANGLAGTVATATTTPAITLSTTITGVLKGNATAISAATAGTDYSAGTSALATGILKSTTTTGGLTIAVAGDFPTLNQNTTGTSGNGFFYLSSSTGAYGGTNSTLAFTGIDTTAVGVSAGNAISTGTDGTFYGYKAGILATGNNNTIVGSKTLLTSAAASDILAIGYFTDSTSALTTGSTFIAIGNSMTLANAAVTNNVMIGHSITNNSTSTNSVLIGGSVSDTSTTGNNVVIGKGAATTKAGCTSVGQNSMTQGVQSVSVGASSAATANFAVAFGYNTLAGGTNSMALGVSATTNKASNIVFGANLTASAFASCVVMGTSTSGQLDPTTATNQWSMGTPDVPINDLYLGRGAKGDATLVNVSVNGSAMVGADKAGGTITIRPSNGTGTGGSGAINFQTAPVAASSSTANTMATVGAVSNAGAWTLGAASTTPIHRLNTTSSTGSTTCTLGTNSPSVATTPTGWISISINGTTSYIPYFQ